MVTVEELAWAAGLFEGEGTITIGRRGSNDTYRLQVMVPNTDEQIIDFFHTRWGGWKEPLYGERPRRRPGWTWIAAGPTGEQFLRGIAPHLRTERVREKLALGMRFRELQNGRGIGGAAPHGYKDEQRAIYLDMKVLNRRGLPAQERVG